MHLYNLFSWILLLITFAGRYLKAFVASLLLNDATDSVAEGETKVTRLHGNVTEELCSYAAQCCRISPAFWCWPRAYLEYEIRTSSMIEWGEIEHYFPSCSQSIAELPASHPEVFLQECVCLENGGIPLVYIITRFISNQSERVLHIIQNQVQGAEIVNRSDK